MTRTPWGDALPRLRTPVVLVPLAFVAIVLASTSAVALRPPGSALSSWWPAAGLGTALLVFSPVRRWAPLFVGLVLTTALSNFLGGRTVAVSGLFGVANALEALTAAVVLGAHRGRPVLRGGADFLRLVLAALAGAVVIAVIGSMTVAVFMGGSLTDSAWHLVAVHLTSQLLILPLVLSLAGDERARFGAFDRPPLVRAAAAAATLAVFAVAFMAGDTVAASAFVPLPAMVLASLLLPRREVAALMLAVGFVTTAATAQGRGPLALQAALTDGPASTLAQLYLAILFLVTIPLVVLVEQRTSALTTAESVLSSTTESAIIGTDRDCAIQFFNVGAERMLGWSASEVVGLHPAEVYLEDGGPSTCGALMGVAGPDPDLLVAPVISAGAMKADRTWRRKDGSTLVVSVNVTEVRSPAGELEGYLAVAADVTDRLEVKQRLRDALAREQASVAELERVSRMENDFVSAVSHELRTPLTTILGNTQLLAAHIPGPLTEDQERVVDRLHRSGRRLLMLVEDLLTLTAVESRAATRHVAVRTGDVVELVVHQAVDLAEGRDLDVTYDDRAADAAVLGDVDELERALFNLVSNAVKFTPEGGAVRVTSRHDGDCLVWSVSDTGLGVSESDRDHLFERFFRARTVTDMAIPGTGLGLPIVELIAQAHGGSVRYVPHEGAGSTFEIRLPVAPVPAQAPAEPSGEAPDDVRRDGVRLGEQA
ncbi:ATP-binding protein [Nocardioides sp.]|uniref:ATP-binding protein n=1 Tax=Nocardioides sp. TaxID=35761 RepID=UPI0026175589|nr:ATP-binding protein [Nocardioides sp.]